MSAKEKIAFVCQRYGLEVNGGAELHCRQLAEQLSALYDVTVYTTCAQDYVTWKNVYQPGEEDINGVHVKRYPVRWERNGLLFKLLSKKVFLDANHSNWMEQRWIDAQGPFAPAAIEALRAEHDQYRVVFFMTYLYYLTVRGSELNLSNAALIPTVHDEQPVYLRVYEKVFGAAKAFAWNTHEEQAFATKRFPSIANTPGSMMGVGIQKPEVELPELPAQIQSTRYLVYAGRIDENKGCLEMFEFFQRYKRENGGDLKLVLMGKPVIEEIGRAHV